MLKEKIAKWIAYAVIDWIRENGDEMLQEAVDWLVSLVDEGKVFTAAPEGLNPEWCEAQRNKLQDILEGEA